MKLGGKHYRTMQNELDQLGLTTLIHRAGKACYQVIVDYEVIRQYRTRGSCNKFLVKLHDQHFPKPGKQRSNSTTPNDKL